MKKIWEDIANSFQEAEDFDRRYYRAMSMSERLDIMQSLREERFKIKGGPEGRGSRRLQRVIKIIDLAT